MEAIKLQDAIILAERNFAFIKAKGKKFIERNAQKFMRDFLWHPYYLTRNDKDEFIHVISFPKKEGEKIYFKRFLIRNE